ncbi:unnamed protein product, partial [Brenthis ino]
MTSYLLWVASQELGARRSSLADKLARKERRRDKRRRRQRALDGAPDEPDDGECRACCTIGKCILYHMPTRIITHTLDQTTEVDQAAITLHSAIREVRIKSFRYADFSDVFLRSISKL